MSKVGDTGQGQKVSELDAPAVFEGQPVAKGKEGNLVKKDLSVLNQEQQIEEREAEIKQEPSVAQQLDKLSKLVSTLKKKTPADIGKIEGELKEAEQDFTMAYNVVDLMGNGEEATAVKGFLNSILSVIKSLLTAIGLMKQVDAKGNLPPEKQEKVEQHLNLAAERMKDLGAKQIPKANAVPIVEAEQIVKGEDDVVIEAPVQPPESAVSVIPVPPPFPSKVAAAPAPPVPQAPPLPSAAQASPEVKKPVRPSANALLEGAGRLKKAQVESRPKPVEDSVVLSEMAKRRGVIEVEEGAPEEFVDEYEMPASPKTGEAKVPPKIEEKKVVTPVQEKVVRPKALPGNLADALKKGKALKKVEVKENIPVKEQTAQDLFAASPLLKQVQQNDDSDDESDDEWDN